MSNCSQSPQQMHYYFFQNENVTKQWAGKVFFLFFLTRLSHVQTYFLFHSNQISVNRYDITTVLTHALYCCPFSHENCRVKANLHAAICQANLSAMIDREAIQRVDMARATAIGHVLRFGKNRPKNNHRFFPKRPTCQTEITRALASYTRWFASNLSEPTNQPEKSQRVKRPTTEWGWQVSSYLKIVCVGFQSNIYIRQVAGRGCSFAVLFRSLSDIVSFILQSLFRLHTISLLTLVFFKRQSTRLLTTRS